MYNYELNAMLTALNYKSRTCRIATLVPKIHNSCDITVMLCNTGFECDSI